MNRIALNYYQKVASQIESFCKPLKDYLGISFFLYFKVYKNDSSYIFLSNDITTTKNYCSKIDSDIFYFQNYINKGKKELLIWPKEPINIGMQQFFSEGYWHGFAITTDKNTEYTEQCVFLSSKNNARINEFYIKYHKVLENFSEHFKCAYKDIISNADLYRAKYKNGFNLYMPKRKIESNLNSIQSFIKITGIDKGILNQEGKFVTLTPREKQCVQLINEGLSLKGIGKELLLAPKTIEAHIKNIKNKTGYHSKKDLIFAYREVR